MCKTTKIVSSKAGNQQAHSVRAGEYYWVSTVDAHEAQREPTLQSLACAGMGTGKVRGKRVYNVRSRRMFEYC